MSDSASSPPTTDQPGRSRRWFMSCTPTVVMAFGLAAGYGMFASLIGWFLFPTGRSNKSWLFVKDLNGIAPGESLTYRSPAGHSVVITRLREQGVAGDFIALSSVCPHLGCQVHWESNNNRFFCPCHNGAFDAAGNPTEGPPKDAGQTLSRYPLKVDNGLLFIQVPTSLLG